MKTVFCHLLERARLYSLYRKAVLSTKAADCWKKRWQRVNPGDCILDLGCGTGDSLDTMPEVNYLGLDTNAGYIEWAKARFGTRGEFRVFDINTDSLYDTTKRDLVLANGVLHHLDDGAAIRLMKMAGRLLEPTGRLLTLDAVFHARQPRVSRKFVSWDRGSFVRQEEDYLRLARSVFPLVEHEIISGMLRIPFSHIVMECRPPKL